MTEQPEPRCEVCGIPASAGSLTIVFSKNNELSTCYCDLCSGLVKAGLLRPEIVNGKKRYRSWHIGEWTPGKLLPETS